MTLASRAASRYLDQMLVADLHIHSRFSRATAKSLNPENLWLAAQRKGIDLLGAGDFTHPAWLEELGQKLLETGDGAYALAPELCRELQDQVPAACAREVRFLLSGEISTIYKRHGATRKVHSLILMPDLEAAARLNARLDKLGNITSDGRPILGLDTHDLLELCLEVEPSVVFIPAHVWTPWFSLFGSKSGFDSMEECFGDLAGHITAVETGLSSDPPMNWRLSALDNMVLVSNSDAHSPAKLAREANLLTCEPTYPALARALSGAEAEGLAGTLEFFPHEGKYHLDGHRKCGVCLEPGETRSLGGRCPVCGKPLTVGVLSRVEDLADRPEGFRPPKARDFESIVPLDEVVGEVLQRGPATKGVRKAVDQLLDELGPELHVLRSAPLDELERVGGPVLSEAVGRMRSGRVVLEGGFDGQFGVVKLFSPEERARLKGQGSLWRDTPAKPRKPKKKVLTQPEAPAPLLVPLVPSSEGLSGEQRAAVEHRGAPLIVRAGPGAGKTRVLVQRAAALVEQGAAPGRVLLITFTRKAAGELVGRLASEHPSAAGVKVSTFHALGREVLAGGLGGPPRLMGHEERAALVKELAKALGWRPGQAELGLTRLKQAVEPKPSSELKPLFRAYQEAMDRAGLLDLDDLVPGAARALRGDQTLAAAWAARWDHVLVDEYQDSNPAQVELLQWLVKDGACLAAIGDPDQAIYGFRGAERENFLRFSQDFPGARLLGLTANFRNAGPILGAATGLMARDPDPGRLALKALDREGEPPLLAELASPRAEAAWVAERIVELSGGLDSRQVEAGQGGEGLAPRDIAVLYRIHAQAAPLAEALAKAGVPFQVAGSEPLGETDPLDFKAQRVSLLTLHAAKGLEFKAVFLVGLEQGLLPYEPPSGEASDPSEERRLVYVGMTRARERLFLSRAKGRSLFGESGPRAASPFLGELEPGAYSRAKIKARRRAWQMDLFGG
ncbi:MAG: UvrD-helicase domain-containing protein [Desulfarculaceae bacterium]|nr:UvrD-helicase domain-containing protein [Desulfarculaceae bacterium]MCF8072205.1 UvrD-helicase domain-containing protein [Desulfarculaceae bacterium]MCF8100126.1 UvrD-helicase domain-containing protein [Desulfarculaceae bacterium]MCF8117225.1 UvrD-helicase domain-containing protein [Desulfarculaceae bacterium]